MIFIIKPGKQFILTLFLLLLGNSAITQSLNGTSGLLKIPTATFQSDRTLILGASFFDKDLLAYSDYQYDAIAGYATLTFLPFLEISIRYTRQIDRGPGGYDSYFADRMPSFRLRLSQEKRYLPSLAIGSTDFITSIKNNGPQFFASYYAVMTKNLFFGNKSFSLEFTLGHAFKIGNPHYYDMLGNFGGIRLYLPNHPWFSIMADYDSRYWNTGLRLFLFNHLQIMPVLRNGKTFEGNIAYHIYL